MSRQTRDFNTCVMESREEFEQQIRSIYQLACKNGLNSGVLNSEEEVTQEKFETFITACHDGFKEAQQLILEKLIEIEKEVQICKAQLKEARRAKNKTLIGALTEKLSFLDYREQVLRKLADSIAWQIIFGHHYVARRLYLGETFPSLLSEGLTETKKIADKLNEDPLNFALIADITSFIQIGDILHRLKDEYQMIEVKSGGKNKEARKILDDLYAGVGGEIDNSEKLDSKMLDQIGRMHRQDVKMSRAASTITNEKGEDPKTGRNVRISEIEIVPETYLGVVSELMQESRKNGGAYAVVEDVIHIGAYREDMRGPGKELLKGYVKMQTDRSFPVFSLMQNLIINISEPIFVKDLTDEEKFDLVTGRVMVYLVIDFDKFIDLLNVHGCQARWLSKRETQQYRERHGSDGLLIFDNQAITIEVSGRKSILGDAALGRILGDNLLPSVVARSYAELLKHDI